MEIVKESSPSPLTYNPNKGNHIIGNGTIPKGHSERINFAQMQAYDLSTFVQGGLV